MSSLGDNWNFRKEKAKSKLSRQKATLTRHINVAENLLKSRGSRRKLRELAAKIEEALKEHERASEEYELVLELEGMQEHLTLTENAIERANLCLESIEISITERESDLYGCANDPRNANDPGPQMIPDRKWSPYWTANDPD